MVLASLDMDDDDAAPAREREALSLNSSSSSSGYLSFSKGASEVDGTEDNENQDKLKDLPARLSADGDMCFEPGPDVADDQLDEESEGSMTTQMVETELPSAEEDQPDALDLPAEGQLERAPAKTDGTHEPDQYHWLLEEETAPADAEFELVRESSPVPTEHSPQDFAVPATILNGEIDVEIPREEPLPSTGVLPPLSKPAEHSGVGSDRPGPYEFSITVDKSHGGKLGMRYDDSSGEYLTIKHLKPGLLYSSMQKNNTSSWLMLEDRIVEVNGVKGSSALLEEQCL